MGPPAHCALAGSPGSPSLATPGTLMPGGGGDPSITGRASIARAGSAVRSSTEACLNWACRVQLV